MGSWHEKVYVGLGTQEREGGVHSLGRPLRFTTPVNPDRRSLVTSLVEFPQDLLPSPCFPPFPVASLAPAPGVCGGGGGQASPCPAHFDGSRFLC